MIICQTRALRFAIITISKYSLHNIYYFCYAVNRYNANNGGYTIVDFINSCTNELIKKREGENLCGENNILKWNNLNINSKNFSFIRQSKFNVNIRNLTHQEIDSLINDALKSNKIDDLEYILKECIENNKLPSLITFNRVLSLYSNNANIPMIEALEKYIKLGNQNFSYDDLYIELHLARANWMKGNIDEAFHIFFDYYKNNKHLKNKIRKTLEILISGVSESTTEATLMLINKHVLYFAHYFDDWYPVYYFWRHCFFSEGFKEQQLAGDLYGKFKNLRIFSSDCLPFISSVALKNHNEDAIIRLLQLLLKHDMMHQYRFILDILFDYRYKRDDFRGCSEIVINCRELNTYLTPDRTEKYISMLLLHRYGCKSNSKSIDTINKPTNSFKFKF